MCTENLLPVGSLVVANNDRLPSPKRQVCQRAFVSHATSQPQDIFQGFIIIAIVPEASASTGRAARSRVNGNDPAISDGRLLAKQHALIAWDSLFCDLHRVLRF